MQLSHPTHHQHVRKRVHKKLQPYPHPKLLPRTIDKLVYLAGIAAPLVTLPQAIDVWVGKQTEGVSLVTWGSFCLIAVVFLSYGLIHRVKPIVFSYACLLVLDIVIVVGVLVNR